MLSFATSFSQLTQTGVSGLSLGALYGIIGVGFVVVYQSTRVVNLVHGASALIGAYLVYCLHVQEGIPYIPSAIVAMIGCAILGMTVERFLIEPVLTRGMSASLMVTLGLLIALQAVVGSIWGTNQLFSMDPWALNTVKIGSVVISTYDISVLVIGIIAVTLLYLFFRFTMIGTAIRATAFNREAAQAQGINPRLVGAISWGLGGALGALAGVLLSTTVSGGVQPGISDSALIGLSVIILGGLDSAVGAVVGGIIIGLASQYAAAYAPAALGTGVASVLPYVVMLAVLLVRPTGLWGTGEIRRI